MKIRVSMIFVAVSAIFMVLGCDTLFPTVVSKTNVVFNLTDAPVDSANIKSVFVKFGGLKINMSRTAAESSGSWIDIPIDATVEYDLLSLTGGVTALLGNAGLTAGTQVNQIRFVNPTIEIVETANPTTRLPCTLASSTGLKIVNAFDVPLTGTLTVTVDFDVRKSLIVTGGNGQGGKGGQSGQGTSPTYRMKPVLRAVVSNEAGQISGSIPSGYAVYAYMDGTYNISEATASDSDSVAFSKSVTSAKAVEGVGSAAGTWHYKLAFLEAGTYDLVVVNLNADPDVVDSATYADIVVASDTTTTKNIGIIQ
jgi:hypothetical protein